MLKTAFIKPRAAPARINLKLKDRAKPPKVKITPLRYFIKGNSTWNAQSAGQALWAHAQAWALWQKPAAATP
jgi:hypothetical protein